ncbi:MAG: hypothetical protein HFF52_05700 [Lawsonibacter sp.]|nr:hypothetical protein [Lawsonibacter sp.]
MLQASKVKQKLRGGQPVIRGFLRFPDPGTAEIMALAGVELIILDQEHYPFNSQEIEKVVRAAQIYGAECMVRVPNSEPARVAQVMESGAIGVVVPHVESRAQAMEVVNAVKYAPVGTRGFCPITRAAAYGMRLSPEEYAQFANEQTCIILMAETRRGLEALDEILTIPQVDGISIGPSDVSASYGYPGHPEHPEVRAAIEEGQKKVAASGKALCVQAYDGAAARRGCALGARIFTVGSDVQVLTQGFQALVQSMRQAEREFEEKGAGQP